MSPIPATLRMMLGIALLTALLEGAAAHAGPLPALQEYRSLRVEGLADDTGRSISTQVRDAITRRYRTELAHYGFDLSGKREAQAELRTRILSCTPSSAARTDSTLPSGTSVCLVAAVLIDSKTANTVTNWVLRTRGLPQGTHPDETEAVQFAHEMAEQTARLLDRTHPTGVGSAGEDLTASGAHIVHLGDGVFLVSGSRTRPTIVDLKRVTHRHDPAIDKDVPYYTNVTLNDVVPLLLDEKRQPYAQITVYHVNPPLAGLPSKEAGVDRGLDFRTPADLVKSAYSNFVSPVLTNDAERRRIPSHPIGHFYVKVEIPGYPTLLTGMTTIERSDSQLLDMTIGRELGIGGVLLTPQPGRLESAMDVAADLALRQRELRVVDGLNYEPSGGRNIGPEYVQSDGNVVFARFAVPVANAKDALAYFVEFVARGEHNTFGSLVDRPNKGTGSGCASFAMSWLQAAGVIPFLVEPVIHKEGLVAPPSTFDPKTFWKYLLQRIDIPWQQIGCDERLGLNGVLAADYTIHDLLLHRLSRSFVEKASAGLTQKIREHYGAVAGTLFEVGALTPIRDLVIYSKRKDPNDLGNYSWAKEGEGLRVQYWDGSRLFHWISQVWLQGERPSNMHLLRERRFKGMEVDATAVHRQADVFFHEADESERKAANLAFTGPRPSTCEPLFHRD